MKAKGENLDLARELKQLWNMGVAVIPVVTGELGMVLKGFERKIEELDPDDSIVKISQNTENSPGDLRGLAVTETLGKTIN